MAARFWYFCSWSTSHLGCLYSLVTQSHNCARLLVTLTPVLKAAIRSTKVAWQLCTWHNYCIRCKCRCTNKQTDAKCKAILGPTKCVWTKHAMYTPCQACTCSLYAWKGHLTKFKINLLVPTFGVLVSWPEEWPLSQSVQQMATLSEQQTHIFILPQSWGGEGL